MNRRITAWRLVCRVLSPHDDATISRLCIDSQRVEPFWPQVLRFTDAHLVTPAFWAALVRKRLLPNIPNEAQQYMSTLYRLNARRNSSLSTQLDEAIRVLNGCAVVPVLLKGAAYLKEGIYRDPAARIFSDLDLLIREAEVPMAVETLKGIGYRANEEGMNYTEHRHVAPIFRPGDYGAIEIHRRCVRRNLEDVLQHEAVWECSIEKNREGLHYRVLSPTHMAMLSFLHSYIIDRFGETFTIGLRPIQDLLALDTAYGRLIDWDGIHAQLNERNLQRRLREYLLIANRLTGFRATPSRFGGREWARYGVSVARIRWPKIEKLTNRLLVRRRS